MLKLVEPSLDYFDSYLKALKNNYAYGTAQPYDLAKMAQIEADPAQHLIDLETFKEGSFKAVDGSEHPKVPQNHLWIVKNNQDFVGAINFRPKLSELLTQFGGHIGYSVAQDFRGNGYATQALALFLASPVLLAKVDRPYILLTTDPSNIASQKVILANGGKLIAQHYCAPMQKDEMIYHIDIK